MAVQAISTSTGVVYVTSSVALLGTANTFTALQTISAASGAFLDFAASGVSHGMTGITPATVYGRIRYVDSAGGGLTVYGLSDTDQNAVAVIGIIGSTNPADTTPAVVLQGGKANGTSWQALGAAETVFQVKNFTTTLLTMLGDGASTAVGAWTFSAGVIVGATQQWHSTEASSLSWWTTASGGNGTGLAADANNLYLRVASASRATITATTASFTGTMAWGSGGSAITSSTSVALKNGVNFGPGAVTSITVVDGLITAIS